jgi:hypothetical protein
MKREKTWLYTLPPELARAMEEVESFNPVTLNAVNLQVAGSKGKAKMKVESDHPEANFHLSTFHLRALKCPN